MKQKTKANRSADCTARLVDNIGVLPSGVYRVRKQIDGVCYSKNFTNLRKAKNWLKNL